MPSFRPLAGTVILLLRIFADRLPAAVLLAKVETVIAAPGELPLMTLLDISVATSASPLLSTQMPSLLLENVLECPPAPIALTVRFDCAVPLPVKPVALL